MTRTCLALFAAVSLALSGCAAQMKEAQLQNVAKDWFATIRASQVIPVYPLTEDLLPGDVFTVTTPAASQQSFFRDKGYLPLDQHKVRLGQPDYASFYHQSHGVGAGKDIPYRWRFPASNGNSAPSDLAGQVLPNTPPAAANTDGRTHKQPTAYWQAPRAYFPTYTFSVRASEGLNLAFPVQSVPVGLSMMECSSASGSVQLADAYVFGVSENELDAAVRQYAADHSVRLGELVRANPSGVFLRVVNRVYMVGRIQVALYNDETGGGRLEAGKAPPGATLFAATSSATGAGGGNPPAPAPANAADTNFSKTLAEISKSVSSTMPGGSVQIAYASSRSVIASETFDRPLVVGFLAFDYPVCCNGSLGPPVATRESIVEGAPLPVTVGQLDSLGLTIELYRRAIRAETDAAKKNRSFQAAAAQMPKEFTVLYDAEIARPLAPMLAFERAETAFLAVRSDLQEGRRRLIADALKQVWESLNAAN